MKQLKIFITLSITSVALLSCKKEAAHQGNGQQSAIERTFEGRINLDNLADYANQPTPSYITKDNTSGNIINDAEATLGRVLFYDKRLSVNNTISCGSCHKQQYAFSDTAQASKGINGRTVRHSMRLVNARFSRERHFFWNERAASLENQITMPVQDHTEMGYSGENGDPDLNMLLSKLQKLDYYQELFNFVYGDTLITEKRIQDAVAQFVRSIQSFDSKYDEGRKMVKNDQDPFPNFSKEENKGKELFMGFPYLEESSLTRISGGLGCASCHRPPEFDIDPISHNNGITGTINSSEKDFGVTKSPSLRDLVKADGTSNGPFMHTGFSSDFIDVLNHYDTISTEGNTFLDGRLNPGGERNLALTEDEKNAVFAFIKTLAGHNIYTDEKWSDPFEE